MRTSWLLLLKIPRARRGDDRRPKRLICVETGSLAPRRLEQQRNFTVLPAPAGEAAQVLSRNRGRGMARLRGPVLQRLRLNRLVLTQPTSRPQLVSSGSPSVAADGRRRRHRQAPPDVERLSVAVLG